MSFAEHSLVVNQQKQVWGCGANGYKQVSSNHSTPLKSWIDTGMTNAKIMAFSYESTLIVDEDNALWGRGRNASGELGEACKLDSRDNHLTKLGLENVKAISCGMEFSCAVLEDGTAYVTGKNNYGQLGLGISASSLNKWTKVDSVSNIDSCSCGGSHMMLVTKEGKLLVAGLNNNGQLGLGNTTNIRTFTEVPNLTDVKMCSCGYDYSYVLKEDGELLSCGNNAYGQLGLGDITNTNEFTHVMDNVKFVDSGSYHTVIITNDNKAYSVGMNAYGQLGLGDNAKRNTFTEVPMGKVLDVQCGYSHTVIIGEDGKVYTCGSNQWGQLGVGSTTNATVPTVNDSIGNVSVGNNWNNGGCIARMKYLIKLPNGYYTLENSQLVEITDSITPEITNSRGVDIKTIQDNLANISDSFSLVSVDSVELSINALNVASPIVIQKESVELDSKLGHIDLISSEYELGDESGIRVVFKINGMTWYTFHEGEFKILTNFDIPNKPLDELSDTELTKLQKSIQAIAECGIDIKEINNIDFNKLDIKSIKLAFIIGSNNTESLAKIKNLKIQYDCDADMVLIKDLATTIRDDKLSVSTNNNYGKLKVNVVANKL